MMAALLTPSDCRVALLCLQHAWNPQTLHQDLKRLVIKPIYARLNSQLGLNLPAWVWVERLYADLMGEELEAIQRIAQEGT